MIGDIPSDLLATYEANASEYVRLGKPPPRHYNELVTGQVTVSSYATPDYTQTFLEDPTSPLTFVPAVLPASGELLQRHGVVVERAPTVPTPVTAPPPLAVAAPPERTMTFFGEPREELPTFWDRARGLLTGLVSGVTLTPGAGLEIDEAALFNTVRAWALVELRG